jgi:DNA-binding CsgD family transcriptional regulator
MSAHYKGTRRDLAQFTNREAEVYEMLLRGLTSAQMAAELGITTGRINELRRQVIDRLTYRKNQIMKGKLA